MPLYLGLDSSTQSLSALVLEVRGDESRVVFETSLSFDEALPEYGTRHGVLPSADPAVAVSSPVMWADALDVMMRRLSNSGLDLRQLAAISGSAQQHGSVYVNERGRRALASFDPAQPLGQQVRPMLSRAVSPIWMDSSTARQCMEIEAAVGGPESLARRTGSRAFERFTGPQIRKFASEDPAGYAATDRIHLVSSYLASLLAGAHSPVDPGDGSGMNLMDLATGRWWPPAIEATAPGLASKLPATAPASAVVGSVSPYWRARYGLPAARIVIWSGDNPSSLVGVGLVREGRVGISLGTSDTIFGLMKEPRVSATGTGHVFGAPTGDYMGLTCFSNGSLAREHVRDSCGLTWQGFSDALEATPPGNGRRVLVPWFVPEITPLVLTPGAHRCRLDAADAAGNVRAVVEGQMMAMALHSRWMGVAIDRIHATGGAAVNPQILQVMADVFGVEVRSSAVANAAALGAALRAWHVDAIATGHSPSWDDLVRDVAEPPAEGRVAASAARHAIYQTLIRDYETCQAEALRRRPNRTGFSGGGSPDLILHR